MQRKKNYSTEEWKKIKIHIVKAGQQASEAYVVYANKQTHTEHDVGVAVANVCSNII